uniref:Uncharacterized protein n=1 Tax=Anguilla anguilla TaxID=7936 RepID=A0A0E9XRF5_ANGAN
MGSLKIFLHSHQKYEVQYISLYSFQRTVVSTYEINSVTIYNKFHL